eukprot:CAMPEP_0181290460 /NCGR_PEP_ID=MMETSP1101-20121128/1425_1 /TAXON_ID=46948 /ORGANISM="Rhodomonas abbreviata, Strain Caron Lab Isolate" /LENGTH=365 /DNA_ID=CAMNT_0023394745 /DNA_START=80 /DNA_END=1173 /DNA_ORIENTATION=-
MVEEGTCFTGKVLGIEITSEEECIYLTVFDIHRTIKMQTEVGPTTPEVKVEENDTALVLDHCGAWWKLGFSTQEDLSIFTANLSVAQDCAFSKQCVQETSDDVGDDLIYGNVGASNVSKSAMGNPWNPAAFAEKGIERHILREEKDGEENGEIAQLLREVLKSKEKEKREIQKLQKKMEDLQFKLASPALEGTPQYPEKGLGAMSPASLLDEEYRDHRESPGMIPAGNPQQRRRSLGALGANMHMLPKDALGSMGMHPLSNEENGWGRAGAEGQLEIHADAFVDETKPKSDILQAPKPDDADRPYPYMDARYIPQSDILDDGLPPVPRAICAQQHLEILVLMGEAKHLPRPKGDEEKSHYCAELT